MQILFFVNGDFGEGNSAHARFLCYGKGLNELDIENKFFIIKPSEFGDSGINTQPSGINCGVGFEYLSGKTKRNKRLFVETFNLLKAWLRCCQILFRASNKTTVIYCYAPGAVTHLPLLLTSKILGFKTIFEQTELHSLDATTTKSAKGFLFKLSHRFVEASTAFFCHVIFLTTRRLRLYYRARFGYLPIQKMPVVVDMSRFSNLPILQKTFRIGYLGSFAEKDGVPVLLKAYKKLQQENSGLKLRLIGFQGNNFKLEDVLADLGFLNTENIEATGQVKYSQIPWLLAECDVLVIPRINSVFANYGYPIKLAEYLCTGRPVIASNVSDISRDFVDDREIILVEPANVADLALAIKRRYEAYNTYDILGQNGKIKAEELFSYRQHSQKIAEEAEKLLA